MGRVMRRYALRRNTLPLLRPTNGCPPSRGTTSRICSRSIRLFDEGEGQRAGVHVPLESFRRDGGGFALAERGSLGRGAGERRGEDDGSGGEDEGVFAHESSLGASWEGRGPEE